MQWRKPRRFESCLIRRLFAPDPSDGVRPLLTENNFLLSDHFLPHSTAFAAIFQATMGMKASRLVAIDMLKGLCGFGGNVPLMEDDFFDENGEIDEEKFEEYLMQEDDNDEQKKKALLALVNMIGQRIKKRKRGDVHESRRRENRPRKKTRIAHPRWVY